MVYTPLSLPTSVHADIRQRIQLGVEPFLQDVHTMLRLPLTDQDLDAGCNLAAVGALFMVIDGVAQEVYHNPKILEGKTGDRFKTLLVEHYP